MFRELAYEDNADLEDGNIKMASSHSTSLRDWASPERTFYGMSPVAASRGKQELPRKADLGFPNQEYATVTSK